MIVSQPQTATPSAERPTLPTLPHGAMGLPFRRRFQLLRSGATYQAMLDGNPQPNRRALRDMVRARTLKGNRRPKETHPEFVVRGTASVASSPASDTPEQIADLIDNA